MADGMSYAHTQRGRIHWLLWVVAAILLGVAFFARVEDAPWVRYVLVGAGLLTLLFGFCFQTLTVRDEGKRLGIRFGPVALFKLRISYSDIGRADVARSRWIDGLGIHWLPARGWTWNIWGCDCVDLLVKGKPLRIGSDDAAGLAAFLGQRIGGRGA